MKLLRKSKPKEEAEEKVTKPREKKREEPKDPTRWLPLLFLLIFLFVSYLFWVAY